MKNDNYFGVCPLCHETDGYINIGATHWFICEEHKTKWCAGESLFSSWMDETEEEQQAERDRLGFSEYREVEPFRPEAGDLGV